MFFDETANPRDERHGDQIADSDNALICFRVESSTARHPFRTLSRELNQAIRHLPVKEVLARDYPTGLPWMAYPHVSKPAYKLQGISRISILNGTMPFNDYSLSQLKLSIQRQKTFIFLENPTDHEWNSPGRFFNRYLAGVAHQLLCPDTPIMARLRDSDDFMAVSSADLINQHVGRERMSYNVAHNFKSIGFKALSTATEGLQPYDNADKYVARLRDEWLHHKKTDFGGADSIQFLYGLLNGAAVRTVDQRREVFSIKGRMEKGSWIGTGLFEPCDHSLWFSWFIEEALSLDLVLRELNGDISITQRGRLFLGLLHPDNNDPDCLLRFQIPGTTHIKHDENVRNDEWCAEYFQKMKVRANQLTATDL